MVEVGEEGRDLQFSGTKLVVQLLCKLQLELTEELEVGDHGEWSGQGREVVICPGISEQRAIEDGI